MFLDAVQLLRHFRVGVELGYEIGTIVHSLHRPLRHLDFGLASIRLVGRLHDSQIVLSLVLVRGVVLLVGVFIVEVPLFVSGVGSFPRVKIVGSKNW